MFLQVVMLLRKTGKSINALHIALDVPFTDIPEAVVQYAHNAQQC